MADVQIKGLRALDRALGKADKTLRTELRTRLKKVADLVAQEARSIASKRVRSGDLVAGIKPYALTGKAGVRSTAIHRGYAYPKRLEYEGRRGYKYGPRASVNPAVERRLDDLNEAMDTLLDDIADDFNRRGLL